MDFWRSTESSVRGSRSPGSSAWNMVEQWFSERLRSSVGVAHRRGAPTPTRWKPRWKRPRGHQGGHNGGQGGSATSGATCKAQVRHRTIDHAMLPHMHELTSKVELEHGGQLPGDSGSQAFWAFGYARLRTLRDQCDCECRVSVRITLILIDGD